MRCNPGDGIDVSQQLSEVARRVVGRRVVVHDLPEQLDLPAAARNRLPDVGEDVRLGRIRSCPRVYGTTQNAQ